jgi:SagB-type dehydrogenase family enzyme
MLENVDSVVAISPFLRVTISRLSPKLRDTLMMLTKTACSGRWISEALAHEEGQLIKFYRYLSCLMRHQMLYIYAGSEDREKPLATLIPISPYFHYAWVNIQSQQSYRLSRFAYLRRDEDGFNYLESPLSHARVRLDHVAVASLIYLLSSARTPDELAQHIPDLDRDDITSLLALFTMGNFVSSTTSDGRLREDEDETLLQWEFHDLLFHSRSREGRHDNLLGGTFRFLDRIPPQPAVKQNQWSVTIPLPCPDMDKLRVVDKGLTEVMEARTSLREHGNKSLTITQLGEFLYRVARVKAVYRYEEEKIGDFTQRPYPGSGASYEMEFYLTIDRCEGLKPGFYWYDALNHALSLIKEANDDTERLLVDACQSTGTECRPQVLITLAARFQRVSWKYQSIAYALILKNVGVIYSTMYLVATAMDLAPCALGTGDSDYFTKLSGTDYLQETSVGEFILGSKPI